DGARIAAGAEGTVDVDAAVARREVVQKLVCEHGNVPGQSAIDSVSAVAARHHSRAPCGFAARSAPSFFFSERIFPVASERRALKRSGAQIWNLWPSPTNATASMMPAWSFNGSLRDMRPSASIFTISLVP